MEILELDRIKADLKKHTGVSSGRVAGTAIWIWGAVSLCVGVAIMVICLGQGSAMWLVGAAVAAIGTALIWRTRQSRKEEQAISNRIDSGDLRLLTGVCASKKWESDDDSVDHYLFLDGHEMPYWVGSYQYECVNVGDQILLVFTGRNSSPTLVYNLRDWHLGDSVKDQLNQ